MSSVALTASAADIDVRAADVLLMRGKGEVSTLIAWCSDSIYSHAAIMVNGGQLIEAAAHGVRQCSLEDRCAERDHYEFIDAFRPRTIVDTELSPQDRDAVVRKAESLLGTGYPLNSLAALGVLIAIRGKIPQSRRARVLFRFILDYVVDEDPRHQLCSEVVYRSLAECDSAPRRNLAPKIVTTEPTHWPFPPINWRKLIEELWEAKRAVRFARWLAANALRAGSTLSDEAFERALRRARASLGIDPGPDGGGRTALPNPKLVTPLDLEKTPSHRSLGRLMPLMPLR